MDPDIALLVDHVASVAAIQRRRQATLHRENGNSYGYCPDCEDGFDRLVERMRAADSSQAFKQEFRYHFPDHKLRAAPDHFPFSLPLRYHFPDRA